MTRASIFCLYFKVIEPQLKLVRNVRVSKLVQKESISAAKYFDRERTSPLTLSTG